MIILYQAFIFDFDGVLADSELCWVQSVLDFVKAHHLPVSEERVLSQVGLPGSHMLALLAETAESAEEFEREMWPGIRADYFSRMERLRPREGIASLLSYLRTLGVPIACASSSNRAYITKYMEKIGLTDYFSVVVTGDDVPEGRVKPWPDIYLETLRRLELPASGVLTFEDSRAGALAARRAGIRCLLVDSEVTAAEVRDLPNRHIHLGKDDPEDVITRTEEEVEK